MAPGGVSATTLKRINREMQDLLKEDMGDIKLSPLETNMHVWRGSIPGPEGSVYEGGVFQVEVVLPQDYPFTAPKVMFKTRIYHMNISEQGNICIDILKNNWSPALSLFKVMLSLSSLLTDPNPRDPLVPSIATEYVRNRKQHDNKARQWTELYAKPKPVASKPTTPVAVAPPAARPSRSRIGTSQASHPAIPSSSRAATSARSARVASASSTPIVIDDSDDEAMATTPKPRGKRKRSQEPAAAASSSRRNVVAVLEIQDEEQELPSTSRPKRSRTTRSAPAPTDDVIIIED